MEQIQHPEQHEPATAATGPAEGYRASPNGKANAAQSRRLVIPTPSLVVLVGPAGSGKSTFARTHFRPTEVLSSDFFRALLTDSEADQSASHEAFALLHQVADARLRRGKLTVIDATNTTAESRAPLLALAQAHHLPAVAIIFDLPLRTCLAWDAARPERHVGAEVITRQYQQLQRNRGQLLREPFVLREWIRSPEELARCIVIRRPLDCDRRDLHGPFDIIGDVHGCLPELLTLLDRLGYRVEQTTARDGQPRFRVRHPQGRKLVFVGDLTDRGPDNPNVLRLVMDAVEERRALMVMGNHDRKLQRYLTGQDVLIAHGFEITVAQLATEPPAFRERVRRFLAKLPNHLVLDGGRLVVAHAGLPAEYHGRSSPVVRRIALFGVTTGERDAQGLPIRVNWALDYRGRAIVVYGHTPVVTPVWVNQTIDIDTGCVFGNALTALRYPEREIVSIPAQRAYATPPRPLLQPEDLLKPILLPSADEELSDEDAANLNEREQPALPAPAVQQQPAESPQ
jgi:protein phosphatase